MSNRSSYLPVMEHYDKVMFDHYLTNLRQGGDGYCNFGYWTPTTSSVAEAHTNLLGKLLDFLPAGHLTTLDVACGKGASTRDLGTRYPPSRIVGINISTKQLLECRYACPDSKIARMDAANLAFRGESFDQVVCIEAAFHFDTRGCFLAEVHRVLKPGGRLAMTDILSSPDAGPLAPANHETSTMSDYSLFLQRLGFVNFRLVDVTAHCTDGFCDYADKFDREHLPKDLYENEVKPRIEKLRASCRPYLLVFAQKPLPESAA